MPRWLTSYRLGALAVLVILGIIHGSWLRSLDDLILTVVLTGLAAAVRGLWYDQAHPEEVAARHAARRAMGPPPPSAPAWARLWYWLTVDATPAAGLEEGGGLEPPRDCSPTP